MAKRKIILYLTDIALHTNTFRPAKTLEKAIKGELPNGLPYGRIYTNSGPNGELLFKIPQDMQDAIDRGEIEVDIAIPKCGLPTFAGKDTNEKLTQIEKKKRKQNIHTGRTWHADNKSV